jgi:hypothetical protein
MMKADTILTERKRKQRLLELKVQRPWRDLEMGSSGYDGTDAETDEDEDEDDDDDDEDEDEDEDDDDDDEDEDDDDDDDEEDEDEDDDSDNQEEESFRRRLTRAWITRSPFSQVFPLSFKRELPVWPVTV